MKYVFLIITILVSACSLNNSYIAPSNGDAIIIPQRPIWISGTLDKQYDKTGYSLEFPEQIVTNNLEVVNSGFWLNFQNGEMQAIYEFSLSITKPFKEKVYTRTILENPYDPESPFIYEYHLMPEERSTKATHGPVLSVKSNHVYTLRYEVYQDKDRTILLDKVVQKIQAAFDNTSGCIILNENLKPTYMPLEKFDWLCNKS